MWWLLFATVSHTVGWVIWESHLQTPICKGMKSCILDGPTTSCDPASRGIFVLQSKWSFARLGCWKYARASLMHTPDCVCVYVYTHMESILQNSSSKRKNKYEIKFPIFSYRIFNLTIIGMCRSFMDKIGVMYWKILGFDRWLKSDLLQCTHQNQQSLTLLKVKLLC